MPRTPKVSGRYLPEHKDNAQALKDAFGVFVSKARELVADSERDGKFNAEDSHACLDEIDGFYRSIIDNLMSAHRKDEDARQKEAA